jgi:hypothetical protein
MSSTKRVPQTVVACMHPRTLKAVQQYAEQERRSVSGTIESLIADGLRARAEAADPFSVTASKWLTTTTPPPTPLGGDPLFAPACPCRGAPSFFLTR